MADLDGDMSAGEDYCDSNDRNLLIVTVRMLMKRTVVI